MATIGLDRLYYAKITENENGEETYDTPVSLADGRYVDGEVVWSDPVLDLAAVKVNLKIGRASCRERV